MKVKESGCVSGVNRPPAEQGGQTDFCMPPGVSARVLIYLLFCLALLAGLATGALAQDPHTVTLSVGSSTVNEGEMVEITADLSGNTSDHDIDISLFRVEGSTAETDDYCGIPSITISQGMTTGTAQFQTNPDPDNDNKTLILAIQGESLPSGYVPGTGNTDRVTIEITDTGADLPVVTFQTPDESVGEEEGTHEVTIVLYPSPPTCELMIKYGAGGTAIPGGVDYRMEAPFLVPAGEYSRAIPVMITQDSENEGEETARIMLTPGTGYTVGTPNVYTLTIKDTCRLPEPGEDPITVSLSVSPDTVPEGGKATITADLNNKCLPYPTTIPLQVTGGGNADPDDYGVVGSIQIPAGEMTGSVEVQTNPDPDNDPETLVIAISEGHLLDYIAADTSRASVTVFIEDTTLPEVSFESSSSSAVEGSGSHNVDISLSPSPAQKTIINYRDDGTGTAEPGTDYDIITEPGGITVEATEQSQKQSREMIQVNLTANDEDEEGPKTVVLALAEGNGYVLGSVNKHTLIIADDDPPQSGMPEVSISGGTSVDEGETAIFTLTASPQPENNINVNVEVIGSSFAASGRRTVTVGRDGTGTLEVITRDDDEDESDDKVTVFVTAGTDYSPADYTNGVSSVPVRDNDEPRPATTTEPPSRPPVTPRPRVTPRPPAPPAEQASPDRAALVEIYKKTGGSDWIDNENWDMADKPMDTWRGVNVDGGEDRVTGLYLHDNGLSGDFPVSVLSGMTELRELALWGNVGLAGAPNDEKTDRAALWVFYKDNGNSAINGWFPEGETDYFSYSDWEGVTVNDSGRVTELDFSDLGLSGETGSELAALSSLEKLDLSGNPDLDGELPAEIMNLSALTYLDISGTQVVCPSDDDAFRMWLRDLIGNDACEAPAEGTQGGGGGCAVASDAEKGVFQIVLVVFALAAAGACRLRRR